MELMPDAQRARLLLSNNDKSEALRPRQAVSHLVERLAHQVPADLAGMVALQ
jgi:hypothetical protein